MFANDVLAMLGDLEFFQIWDGWLYEWFNAYHILAIYPSGASVSEIFDEWTGNHVKPISVMYRKFGVVVFDECFPITNSPL